MLKRCITSQTGRKPIETAAPNQGAAVFFCSTGTPFLWGRLRYYPVFQQQVQKGEFIVFHNLLTGKHYFRLNRAETPLANVVLTEGQKCKHSAIREVAA